MRAKIWFLFLNFISSLVYQGVTLLDTVIIWTCSYNTRKVNCIIWSWKLDTSFWKKIWNQAKFPTLIVFYASITILICLTNIISTNELEVYKAKLNTWHESTASTGSLKILFDLLGYIDHFNILEPREEWHVIIWSDRWVSQHNKSKFVTLCQ